MISTNSSCFSDRHPPIQQPEPHDAHVWLFFLECRAHGKSPAQQNTSKQYVYGTGYQPGPRTISKRQTKL